jgi:glucose/arabinose dehydrogenase
VHARLARWGTALAVFVAVLALVPGRAAPVAAAQLPAGFSVETIGVGQSAGNLTGFAMVPAGDPAAGGSYAIGKDGKVTWASADGQTLRTIAQLPAWAHQDIGLIGINLTRTYGTTGRLLVVYTDNPAGTQHYAHAAIMQVDDPADPHSLVEVQPLISGANSATQVSENSLSHGPGTIAEGPDGYIYIGFGDEARYQDVDPLAYRAQQLDDPHGKILRVDATGHGVPGNAYYDAAQPDSWRSKIFARGVRNPFRFDFDARTGRLYIGDVGWQTWEEIDVARGGENFGWPCYEGNGRTTGYSTLATCQQMYAAGAPVTPPLYTYNHNATGAAAVGGVFYQGTSYPAAYRGRYFFADYARQTVSTLGTDTNDRLTTAPSQFGAGIGAPVDFGAAPNGDIVFADIASGTLKRLRYASGNRAPTAVAEATNDPSTLTVGVDASGSYDLDGDQLTFSTDYGDGTPALTGPVTQHQYAAPGQYTVTVTVRDPAGGVGRQTLAVTPQNHTPTLQLTAPPADHTFSVGDPVTLSASATDAEDGALQVTWQVVLQHCPFGGPCHEHPDQTLTGPSFSEPFTDHGEDTYMQITASATDSTGAVVSETYAARPQLQTVAVTSPVPVTINGFTVASLRVVAGQNVTVAAPATAQEWTFRNWSDGGAAQHSFPAPAADVTLTASFGNAIDDKYAQLGGPASALGAVTGTTIDLTGALAGGRYRPFVHGVIIWSAGTGAHEVRGSIQAHYWPVRDTYGFPVTDEIAVTGGRASYFERGREYWSAGVGAWFVRGGNLTKYLELGGPDGYGLPLMDERPTPDTLGRYQHFSPGNRSIYYFPGIGSHEVHGGIRATWASLGWERSRLGYPTSDEFAIVGGRRNNFQHGYITWSATTKATTVRYA